MTALITLSHGSRHTAAEPAVRRLTRAVGEQLGVPTIAAHLDFTAPTLPEAAARLVREGAGEAVVVPLLFTRAFHAKNDVPAVFREAIDATGMRLQLARGLGTGADVAELLAARVRADAPAGAHLVLYSVGSADMAANQDVVDLAHAVGRMTDRTIEVIPATGGAGKGGAGLIESALQHPRVHVLPLFVADGLLLDKITTQLDQIGLTTGTEITASRPMGTALADIVASRYHEEMAALTQLSF